MNPLGGVASAVGGVVSSPFGGWSGLEDKSKVFLFGSGKTTANTSHSMLPATAMQAAGEGGLLAALQSGYNPYMQQQQLAGQTGGLLQRLLGYGLNGTPEQNAMLEAQTTNFMQGLQNQLDQYQKRAMSQAQQSALARGIPLSDIARGQEANVNAQVANQLGQGYTQAKGQELQNKLNLPMQNIGLLAGLQNQMNSPLMQMLYGIGMSRYNGPYNQQTVGTSPTPGLLQSINMLMGQGEAMAPGGTLGPGLQTTPSLFA